MESEGLLLCSQETAISLYYHFTQKYYSPKWL